MRSPSPLRPASPYRRPDPRQATAPQKCLPAQQQQQEATGFESGDATRIAKPYLIFTATHALAFSRIGIGHLTSPPSTSDLAFFFTFRIFVCIGLSIGDVD